MNINDLVRQSREKELPNGIDTSLSPLEQFKRAQQIAGESAQTQNNDMNVLHDALNKAKAGEPPLDSFQG